MTTLNARTERKQWAATLKSWWQRINTPIITISLPTATTMLLVLYIELLAAAAMLTYVATKVWGVN